MCNLAIFHLEQHRHLLEALTHYLNGLLQISNCIVFLCNDIGHLLNLLLELCDGHKIAIIVKGWVGRMVRLSNFGDCWYSRFPFERLDRYWWMNFWYLPEVHLLFCSPTWISLICFLLFSLFLLCVHGLELTSLGFLWLCLNRFLLLLLNLNILLALLVLVLCRWVLLMPIFIWTIWHGACCLPLGSRHWVLGTLWLASLFLELLEVVEAFWLPLYVCWTRAAWSVERHLAGELLMAARHVFCEMLYVTSQRHQRRVEVH